MSDLTERQRALIGKESGPVPAPYPVNEAMARFWCEMVEDGNPVYFDDAYARSTWIEGTFAPPTMLYTWGRPLLWPPTERESAIDRLELDDCPAAIAVSAVQEYLMPIRYGDRLTVTSQISSISEEKTTRLGTGRFVTSIDTFRNQLGQVVGTHTFTIFRYRPATASPAK